MSNMLKPINKTFTVGKWMPSDEATLRAWMEKILAKAQKSEAPLLPVIENFKNFIETDPKAYMFFTQMFDQVAKSRKDSPANLPQVRDYQHMLELMNVIMTHAPDFDETGLVGFPLMQYLIGQWRVKPAGRVFK